MGRVLFKSNAQRRKRLDGTLLRGADLGVLLGNWGTCP
jgi:hypothetical protein